MAASEISAGVWRICVLSELASRKVRSGFLSSPTISIAETKFAFTGARLRVIAWSPDVSNSGAYTQGVGWNWGFSPLAATLTGINTLCTSSTSTGLIRTPYLKSISLRFRSSSTAGVNPPVERLSGETRTPSTCHSTLPPRMIYWSITNLSFSLKGNVGLAIITAL